MTDSMGIAILGVIFGTLCAIIYSLRVLVLLERRIARMDAHIEIITKKIAKEEIKIEANEEKIMKSISSKKKTSKKKK